MKKLLSTFILLFAILCANAQVTTLTFVGKDRTGQDYVQLDRVSVFNQTQLWHEVLYYPDTTLRLGAVGIEDYVENGFQLMQNVPNPFDGVTDFALSLPSGQDVQLEIYDVNGKKVAAQDYPSLSAGTHLFRATLSAPQTYLLSASTHEGKTSIKMINTGDGGGNNIVYLGMANADGSFTIQLKGGRGTAPYPFVDGDLMQYTGYAVIDGTERVSDVVEKNQNNNETIALQFDVAKPAVTTNAASNVMATSVAFNGEVTADNNALVTERGFCYAVGTTAPTIADNTVAAGAGTGLFSAVATGLQPGKNYRVRAYAKNAVGLSYGLVKNFVSQDTLPVVTTTQPSGITATAFVGGGEVVETNCLGTATRGICWNTTGTPTVADAHTSDGTGTGTFVSSVSGLDCGATYHVRAYATNSVGTAYGEEYSVTTLTATAPSVNTLNCTLYNGAGIVVSAEVLSSDCEDVTSRGVCYSATPNPTINNASYTTNGNGLGNYADTLTGLELTTTYYVRAYATNSVGTAYGEEYSVTTYGFPTLTTSNVSSISYTSATCGGDVTADGGGTVIARGVCWSTSQNPTVNGSHTTDGGGLGSFTSSITGLVAGTTYYVRAYATNVIGTVYGEQKQFTTTSYSLPSLTTSNVTSITYTSATCGGNVTADGGATVTARGVCWSTSQNPTTTNSKTTNGSGTGSFTSSITGLSANTTYYVRAYATNSAGTAYGEQKTFTTMAYSLPTVTTSNVTNITDVSATCGGNVTSDGGATVTARGVCWSTSQNPTTANSKTTNGSGTSSFTSSITGLAAGTTYYVRAYATNSVGTAYGEQKSFTTSDCPSTVTDRNGNSYNTVLIGTQCWMKDNLKTSGGQTYYPGGSPENEATYGLLYKWETVMSHSSSSNSNPSGVQGICPSGWHVPSDAEWTQLTDYVSSQNSYCCNGNSDNIAKALASTTDWISSSYDCVVGNNPSSNNATGFSALPAGNYRGFYDVADNTVFWSATETDNTNAYTRSLYYNRAGVSRSFHEKTNGCSVRCVKD